MASAGARAYMGVWGLAPSGVQGQSPWSGGQGGEAPLKLMRFLHYGTIFVSKCLYTLPNSVAFVNEQQTGNLQVFLCYARTFYLSGPVAYYHDFWAWAIFYIFPSLIIFHLSLYYSLPSNVVLRRFDPRINIRVSTFLYMSLGVFLRTNIVFVRRHYMQWCIGKI